MITGKDLTNGYLHWNNLALRVETGRAAVKIGIISPNEGRTGLRMTWVGRRNRYVSPSIELLIVEFVRVPVPLLRGLQCLPVDIQERLERFH